MPLTCIMCRRRRNFDKSLSSCAAVDRYKANVPRFLILCAHCFPFTPIINKHYYKLCDFVFDKIFAEFKYYG